MKEKTRKSTPPKQSRDEQTAQQFTNIVDIKDHFLYTKDGYIIMFLKIESISIDLLSIAEQVQVVKTLTAGLSAEKKPYKLISISRPVDISPIISHNQTLMLDSNSAIQKALLRQEMLVMSEYAMSGEVVERQFYLSIWERCEEGIEKEIYKRIAELESHFQAIKVRTTVLGEKEIIRFCNLVNNPAFSHIENTDYDTGIVTVLSEINL